MENFDFIFRRTHSDYRKNRAVWEKSKAAYAGGSDYIRDALIRHVSEIDIEFAERLRRAYYFNYPRRIAQLITQYIFATEPQRINADALLLEDFSRTGARTGEVMRQFSTLLNIFGKAALLVEMPFFEGELDYERCRKERIRPFAKALSPLEAVDYAYGSDGKLDWLIVEEETLQKTNPFEPEYKIRRRKLFTRNEFMIFERNALNSPVKCVMHCKHALGAVPAVIAGDVDGAEINGGHYFEDIVRISDAILNNESEAQMNMIKQMFGLLVISDSFARCAQPTAVNENTESPQKFSHIIARSAAIWESPEEKGISRYISPGGADTKCIREENLALKRELFDLVGLAAQNENRLLQSADSKAWDHHHVGQFLAAKAELLEQCESSVWEIMRLYDPSLEKVHVAYNRDFSVTNLESSIRALLDLDKFSDSETYHTEVARTALFLLEKLKKIDHITKENILKELCGNSK
ncbi:MAG: hypothetical protein IKA22_10535 [Lentisphaeria bacterium]|nr:hypothetical protein [Lentisphaeria bacterium]